jgi:DUF1680 family protein
LAIEVLKHRGEKGIREGEFETMKKSVIYALLCLLCWPIAGSSETLEPVCLQTIELGGFWKQQAKRLTVKWLPHCVREMEKGGRGQELLNLIALGKAQRGEPVEWKYTGAPWSDAYIYNTVEAICVALAVDPAGDAELAKAQAELRAKLEEWIPIILAAQSPDGYIHSFHVLNKHPRYSNTGWHEFYVMGYFLEMGVAHYRMTGGKDRRLYDAAVKCGDHLCDTFGPPPKRTWRNGHPGMEYALCRLGRLVNEVSGAGKGDKYIQLARHFLDHQHVGEKGSEYNQSEKPAVEMSEAKGHAVRATYFYTAMTDVALQQGDAAYQQAVDRIWTNAIHRKHYLTGGVGASHKGEAFDGDFVLPNNGYCESCASCGLSFWSDRMHRLHQDAHYRDVQERVLYNNLLGSFELAGENFYYQNPLESNKARYPWHGCPCCVGNIPRALLAIKDLIYSVNPARTDLYLSHFVDSVATLPGISGTSLRIRQETPYPWDGDVVVTLNPATATDFTLRLRIPNRTESELYSATPSLAGRFTVRVNGEPQSLHIDRGYVALRRTWKAGDRVELSLPMDVQRVHCEQRVVTNRGRVALQRGPIVYNVEDVDQSQPVKSLILKPDLPLKATWKEDLLGGVMVIEGPGIMAIPNYARLNRGGASQVWLVEDPDEVARNKPVPAEMVPGYAGVQKRTVDSVLIGDEASEKQHAMEGTRTDHGEAFGYPWRHAGGGGWFSYRMKVAPEGAQAVYCVYWGSDGGKRVFDILVDGEKIATQKLDESKPNVFFGVEYPIPAKLTAGKQQVTVKFQAQPGCTAGGTFDCRIVSGK